MDSLTQLTLGAAMGEATLGKKLGGKAALWGAFFGTLPDLDVLAAPLLTGAQELAFHRGFTHAALVCTVVAPLLAWPLARRYRAAGATWRDWTIFLLLVLNTHWMVDSLTTYGTQVGLPFTDHPFSIGSMFIIDPLYTVPLLLGLLVALCHPRDHPRRRWSVLLGIGLSTAYVVVGLGLKTHATSVFERALDEQGISYEQMITTPSAFNTLLWFAYVDEGEAVRVGLYSVLDPAPPVAFQRVDKNLDLLEPLAESPALDRLWWFSRGFLTVSQDGDQLTIHDLRFGRSDAWLTNQGTYIFNFDLLRDPARPEYIVDVRQRAPGFSGDSIPWRQFAARVFGDPTVAGGVWETMREGGTP
ncbi:MAG: metal-dependent hydrolase [Bacteroidota bacterium]